MTKSLNYQDRITLTALSGGALPLLLAVVFLYQSGTAPGIALLTAVVMVCVWLWFALSVRDQVREPMASLANMIEALREGDYTLRGRGGSAGDYLVEVHSEVNALSDTMRDRRGRRVETAALLSKLLETVDIAIMTFDADHRLANVNRYGDELLGDRVSANPRASALGLEALLVPGVKKTVRGLFGNDQRRWQVTCQTFRERGHTHLLLVASDVSDTLRTEELNAWRRLIRVISHELNNSLTPIRTLSESMHKRLLQESESAADRQLTDALKRAFELIATRATGLARFVGRYAELARLPSPVLKTLALAEIVSRVCRLESVTPQGNWQSAGVTVRADGVLLEQALINLLRNAKEANEITGSSRIDIHVREQVNATTLEISDQGPGLETPENAFVPFFTTKDQGSGIGLVLARQILESHGGSLILENASTGNGCVAALTLPAD